MNGAGEMLVFSAADFEDFREPRPELPQRDGTRPRGSRAPAGGKRWPWRLHATYDESISRALDVFERVNRDMPFDGLHWIFDHAETISQRNIERVARVRRRHRGAAPHGLPGRVLHRAYGAQAAETTPPITRMLAAGVPVGAGTDATRISSHNPWVSLSWLVTGRTVGGTTLYPPRTACRATRR